MLVSSIGRFDAVKITNNTGRLVQKTFSGDVSMPTSQPITNAKTSNAAEQVASVGNKPVLSVIA